MVEVAPTPAAAPAKAPVKASTKASTKAPKKKTTTIAKPKKAGPSVSELIVKAVSASNERSGVSLAALKKALAAAGYDVEKNNSRVKTTVRSLVTKGTLSQTKGTGASGSFKINKKVEVKPAAPKAKKPAAKKPVAAKKAAVKKPVAVKKSPKKAKKPAAKVAAKSPKKATKSPKKAAKPAAAKKAPAKKAVKPKAAKKAAPKKKVNV